MQTLAAETYPNSVHVCRV